jgi:hypothetical protein
MLAPSNTFKIAQDVCVAIYGQPFACKTDRDQDRDSMLVKKMRQSETLDARAPAGPWFCQVAASAPETCGGTLFPDEAITACTLDLGDEGRLS